MNTIFIVIVLFLFFLFLYIYLYKKSVNDYSEKYKIISDSNVELMDENVDLKEKIIEINNKLQKQDLLITDYRLKISVMESELFFVNKELTREKEIYESIKIQTKNEFEILANNIFEHKSKLISEFTEKNIYNVLNPLKEKIEKFERTVDEKYLQEYKERSSLKNEIETLIKLNQQMSDETKSLTNALKGDSKFQGDWGEFVLEKTLECSGLRKDYEYSIQGTYSNKEGVKYRPDVIINLPDNKHIIIDAKMSLKAYENYRNSVNESERKEFLDAHILSIKRHIISLAEKSYTELHELKTPEFVFLFIPIENAYVLAMQTNRELSEFAWAKKIAIVTATTLLTSLKTVASIWKLENQNKNALEIAWEGGKLYDKFVAFMDDFEKIGKTLDLGQRQYQEAFHKLKHGSGNIFKRIENLKELGATPQKQLKHEFIE